jgi:hypothetical protein
MKPISIRSLLLGALDFASVCVLLIFYGGIEWIHIGNLFGRDLWVEHFGHKIPSPDVFVIVIICLLAFGHLWLPYRYGMQIMAALERRHPKVYVAITKRPSLVAIAVVAVIWILQSFADGVILTIGGSA